MLTEKENKLLAKLESIDWFHCPECGLSFDCEASCRFCGTEAYYGDKNFNRYLDLLVKRDDG